MAMVSVIVPVYNVEKYLHRCVDSILAQTFTDFELILVDDGSPDNCGAICDEYARKDSRVRVIHQENQGVSCARNAGIEKATGRYIAYIDSDDYVEQDYLEQLINDPSDLTICGIRTQDEHGNQWGIRECDNELFETREEIDYCKLYRENMLFSPCGKLLNRRIIVDSRIRFPENISWGEDGMYIADYLQYTASIKCIHYAGYHYIKYSDKETLTSTIEKDRIDTIVKSREYCLEKMRETSPRHYSEMKDIIHEDICSHCRNTLLVLFHNKKLMNGEKITLLEYFLKNQYVAEVVANSDVFFANHSDLKKALSQGSVEQMIGVYSKLYRKQYRKSQMLKWIYEHCYEMLPEEVKRLYRRTKRMIKR